MAEVDEVLAGSKRWVVLTGKWQDVLPEGLRVDHVITDPPYSEHVHSKSRAGARKTPLRDGNGRITRCAISREVDFGFECITPQEIEAVADLIETTAKRWALAFADVESAHIWSCSFTEWEYVRTCFWHRLNGTPQFTGDRPANHLEAIVCMHPKCRKRWNGGGRSNVYAHNVVNKKALKRANNNRVHTTQKPLDLMLALVADFTDPGETILDPYCGSGTTGVACIRLGRNFIGCERKPEYAEIARQRIHAEERNTTLTADRAGQLAMFGRNT